MKIKLLCAVIAFSSAFWLSSCGTAINPFSGKEKPTLYPIIQPGNGPGGEKFGYINTKGEVVIQPQFRQAWFFSEGLAVACIEWNKCGYIDETGKFAINPQFQGAFRFSEGLALVFVEGKVGYIDKTGQFVVNPQFQTGNDAELFGVFSEGLGAVRIGDKYGYIDKTGKIVINPQFNLGLPFMEGLAAVRMGEKWGYIDKDGKIVVNPQFEMAHPFVNGLAAVQMGNQWGYIDETGKIAINPQFDFAAPFADEGAALVYLKDKAGYIDKQGKYIVNPQYSVPREGLGDGLVLLALIITSDLGRLSFSEGRALVNVGDSSMEKASFGYADSTGRIVINPQFKLAFPFYGDLALVSLDGRGGFAWIDKEGKIVWRLTKETPKTYSPTSSSMSNFNSAVMNNSNSMSVNTNITNVAPQPSNGSTSSERTGRLTTDSNIRSEASKDAASLGIHFKGAKVKILEETSYFTGSGEQTTWFKIRVYEQGCSVNTSLGCGKNTPNDADEGWVNAKNVLLD